MEKPAPYIHHNYTSDHDQAGVVYIGRVAIPCAVIYALWGASFLVLAAASGLWCLITGANFESFVLPVLIPIALLLVTQFAVWTDDFIHWIRRTVRKANERD